LRFHGVNEYFEDLVASIDTPIISRLEISFFNQLVFDVSQFIQWVGHSKALSPYSQSSLLFSTCYASVTLYKSPVIKSKSIRDELLSIFMWCSGLDWQTSSLMQICTQFSPSSNVEWLELDRDMLGSSYSEDEDDVDSAQWLELFHSFIAVQSLEIARRDGLDTHIVPALQELTGERVMEVLPALRSLSFGRHNKDVETMWKDLRPFITARQLANHPCWRCNPKRLAALINRTTLARVDISLLIRDRITANEKSVDTLTKKQNVLGDTRLIVH
jgi:hypothetical protein